jgi:hypothetical protein
VSSVGGLPHSPEDRPPLGARTHRRVLPLGAPRLSALLWPTLLTAAILCLVTFVAGGGLRLAPMTKVEMALTLGAGVVVAGAVLLAPARARPYGLWSVGLLLAFSALTAISVVWSVQPDYSWQDAGRMFAYCGVFGAAVTLAHVAPARWPALLGGVTLAAVVVCGYALLTKVFPARLDSGDIYARLRAPYDYWNAIGLTAAMGVIGCMWLGARRAGHRLLSALAYPAMGLLLVTLMLAYSRGALAALVLGVALWLCIVPLRLRGVAVLLIGALSAGLVVAWDFSRHALSTEDVALGERVSAGHQLGVLLAAMLVVLTLAGLTIGFCTGRRAPSRSARRNAGAILLTLLVLAGMGFAGALSVSHRGLFGSISHGAHSLTDAHARVPNTPGRLTAIGSVRARYWNEALKVFKDHQVLGAGAMGYWTARRRYRTEMIDVRHAHGYVVQTLADLGLVGLALTLALLAVWLAAAGRSTHPFNRRWTSWSTLRRKGWTGVGWRAIRDASVTAPYTPERIGMLSMLCVVVVFGIHSSVDWTWYVPGNACVALLCAGWLAGRGPLTAGAAGSSAGEWASSASPPGAGAARENNHSRQWQPPSLRGRRPPMPVDLRSASIAAAVLIAALLAAWAQWQPQRSANASQEALALLARDPRGARAAAQSAIKRDPLSVQALFTLSRVQQAENEGAVARGTLQRAVHLQPSNPRTWLALGEHDLASDPRAALSELRAAIYLDPQSILGTDPESLAIQNDYVQALRASAQSPPPVKSASAGLGPATGAARRADHPRRAPRRLGNQSPRAGL